MTLLEFLPKEKPDVQYFDEIKGELSHSQRHKADLFLELGLITYSNGKFFCLPIQGYNTRTYTMEKINGVFQCNCQGYVMKKRAFESGLNPNTPFCSHLLALMHYFRERGNHG